MAGYNPYAGGAWTPNGTLTLPQYQGPGYFPQYPTQVAPTYSGTGSHLYGRQPRNNMPRVSGPESAKAYPMNPGDEIVVFDANEPVFYFLSADDSGFKQMKTFEFNEKAPDVLDVQPQVNTMEIPDLVTKGDFDGLKKQVEAFSSDLSELKEMIEGLVS
jgi:hypothetical protein